MIGPTELLHPSPAPHFKTFQVLLIYFPKCPSFSTIQKQYSKCSTLLISSFHLSPICWWEEPSARRMEATF